MDNTALPDLSTDLDRLSPCCWGNLSTTFNTTFLFCDTLVRPQQQAAAFAEAAVVPGMVANTLLVPTNRCTLLYQQMALWHFV